MLPPEPAVAVILCGHCVPIVVVTLEFAILNSKVSPLKEFPANACPAHVYVLQELARVAVTLKLYEQATGEQPAFATLGRFATQIELAGTGTVWPRLFTVVAGQVTLFPPLGKEVPVTVTPIGGVRMTVLITELPFGVRLLYFAVSVTTAVVAVDGDMSSPKSFAGAAIVGSEIAARASADIKVPSHLRMPFIVNLPKPLKIS